MNEDVLIKCDICNKLFNPGELEDEYPFGFYAICDECIDDPKINLNF